MTYNELAQVLETKNPTTGKLYKMSDLKVFKMSDLGTGMLQDGIFIKGSWIKDPANQATAVKFLTGDVQGLGLLPRPREGVRRRPSSSRGRRCPPATRPGR